MQLHTLSNKQALFPQKLINYFTPPPSSAKIKQNIVTGILFLTLIGAPVTYLLFHSYPSLSTLEFVLPILALLSLPLITGLINLYAYNTKPRLTDEEYNAWVNSWRPFLRQYGMEKLGLDPGEIIGEPLYVRGIVWPHTWEAGHYHRQGHPVIVKHGKDGRPHASINRFTFFYPTQHCIAVFSSDVNALSPLRFEETRTYFYDDIVGIETHALALQLEMVTYTMQRFELRVSSGRSIGATIYAQDAPMDQTVRSLRVLLRDKKYSYGNRKNNWNGS